MKKLIIRDAETPVCSEWTVVLSWQAQCQDGQWAESLHWALLKPNEVKDAVKELRERGHKFEIEDLRTEAR